MKPPSQIFIKLFYYPNCDNSSESLRTGMNIAQGTLYQHKLQLRIVPISVTLATFTLAYFEQP